MMQDWIYTFDPAGKADWIRQLETDLRGKTIESLNTEWWAGETLSPIVHADDLKDQLIRLPSYLFQHPPAATTFFSFQGRSAREVNAHILSALSRGTQCIILPINATDALHLETYLHGVHLDMADVRLQSSTASMHEWSEIIAQTNKKFRLRITPDRKLTELLDVTELARFSDLFQYIELVYRIPSEGNWIVNVSQRFNNILSDQQSLSRIGIDATVFFKNSTLLLASSPTYFKHIIQSRVLHILWQNLVNITTGSLLDAHSAYLECHTDQMDDETIDHFLIRASMSGVAAAMTGTHRLAINLNAQENGQEMYSRVSQNIHHLLELEGNMYKKEDPLAGAYALDYHCRGWAEKIWTQLSVEE